MIRTSDLQNKYLPALAPEDFFLILSYVAKKEKVYLLAHPEYCFSIKQHEQAEALLARRLQHEPVSYLTGQKEFYGRSFRVTKDTLIPRPETELFIENVLSILTPEKEITSPTFFDIIDVGTGSGNIIITLAKEILSRASHNLHTRFFGIDISEETLLVAQENAEHHNITSSIDFLISDLLVNFPSPKKKERHVIIVANLPYLSEKIYQASDTDVRSYEPRGALVSGLDGLDHYRRLLQMIEENRHSYLSTTFFLEISPEQSDTVKKIFLALFPRSSFIIFPDLSGKNRIVRGILL